MNAIKKAIDNLKYIIPPEVLNITFGNINRGYRVAPTSIDENIMQAVIRPRVLLDANLVGGMEVIVPLDGIDAEYIDNYSLVYKIPDERLLHRDIISVLSISYMPFANTFSSQGGSYNNMSPGKLNDVSSGAQRLADSYTNVPPISTAVVDLIGRNTIVVRDQFRISAAYQIRCIVSNEANLNNINPRSYLSFAKLVEYAVKSYIYTHNIVEMDRAYLMGGQDLGAIKTYIETLSDAEENYTTYLTEVWQTVAYMNDVPAYDRLLKLQICPGL